MKRFTFFVLLLLSLGLSYEAMAGCGSATCPLNTHRHFKAGWLTLGVAREYINQNQIYLGSQKSSVGAFRQDEQEHDEVQTTNNRSLLQLQYGMLDRVGLNLELPFIHREHAHIVVAENEWEGWNFSGLGDLLVSVQYAVLLPASEFAPYLSLQAGAKLPTGVTDAKNAEGENAEVTIQPGTGSLDAIFGLYYREAMVSVPTISGGLYGALPLIIGATYRVNGKGTDDWRFGNELIVSVGTEYQLVNRASLLFQVNGKFQQQAEPGKVNPHDVPPQNTGGMWIFASPGLSLRLSEALSTYAYVQIPVYQKVNGIQQTANVNLQLGLSFDVRLSE